MRVLLDTHYLLWSFTNPEKIEPGIRMALTDEGNEIFYSQVSLWEISIKFQLGKLVLQGMSPEELLEELSSSHFQCLELQNSELVSFYRLPIEHRDPFDRMMIWQCIQNDLHFLSVDGANRSYEKYGLKVMGDGEP